MEKIRFIIFSSLIALSGSTLAAQTAEEQAALDSIASSVELQEVTVGPADGMQRRRGLAGNTQVITAGELTRAACCNLGESFTTNPSVDVSYNDAATGARQIKLLGLSGAYVQMLTENIPNFRGSALPFGLSYVAGPWIQSIQVSKGASSVKNGYESITGQVNIEMKKPQADREIAVNGFVDSNLKAEVNANANFKLNQSLSTGFLLHGENSFEGHDSNHDTFLDMPRLRQIAAMDRWAWLGRDYVFQAAVKFLDERRESGQDRHHAAPAPGTELYKIDIKTTRWEAFTKNAYIFDHQNDGNVALILSGSYNDLRAGYGHKLYDAEQGNAYASLMFERKYADRHALSTGLSFNYDHYDQKMRLTHDLSAVTDRSKEIEAVSGAYAQYTFNADERLLLMAGARYDYSSLYGSMLTPRLHARWNPTDQLTLHGSAGRGFRAPHVMAENNFLLASSRSIIIDPEIQQEEAWNYGAGIGYDLEIFGKELNLNAEYYFTDFRHQLIVDLDSDPGAAHFKNLDGRSYSHTLQIEATYHPIRNLTVMAAYRLTDVKTDYGQGLTEKPLTSRNKGLITIGYTPRMGIWQFDVTCSINGGGRMPSPPTLPSGETAWQPRFGAFAQLNAQITRNFRRWAVYIGGENLTGYKQKRPIIGADNPWAPGFDATMVYAPLHGAMLYAGFRYKLNIY